MQNNKILDKTLLSVSSPACKTSTKFIEIIQNVLEILVVFNTLIKQELSVCLYKVNGHLSANFINKSMYVW